MNILSLFKRLSEISKLLRNFFILFFIQIQSFCAQEVIIAQEVDNELVCGDFFLGKDIFNASYWRDDFVLKKNRHKDVIEYQDLLLGKIHSVDFVNPIQIAVFYSNFNTLVLLDRELTKINQFDLSDLLPDYKILFIGSSLKNTFWIIDEMTQTIGQFYPIQNKINVLYQFLNEEPQYFFSDINNLYWVTNDNRLKAIDIYGNIILDHRIPLYDELHIINLKSILYSYDNKLYYFDLMSDKRYLINLNEKSISGFFFSIQKLSIFVNNKLSVYTIKLP